MSRPLIEIDTPNKDIVISFVYAWARQKEMSILEQRVVLRIMEFASNHLKGFKLKDNLRQLDLGLFEGNDLPQHRYVRPAPQPEKD